MSWLPIMRLHATMAAALIMLSVITASTCSITAYTPKVTLSGIPMIPEEQDDYYKFKGPIPAFSNSYGCIQDVVHYRANESVLGETGMITGNISGPCMSGFYYITALPKTNLFLLVIENWSRNRSERPYNFNCKIAQSLVTSGAFRIINGTCTAREDSDGQRRTKCPIDMRNDSEIVIPCEYEAGARSIKFYSWFVVLIFTLIILAFNPP